MHFELQCPPVIRRRLGRLPVFGMMLACACFPYFLTSLPASLLDACRNCTGNLVVMLGRCFNVSTTYGDGILTVSGFAMRLILECTALHYLAIMTAAILLYPRHSVVHKLHGVLFAGAAIILMNALRLLIIGVIGAHDRHLFDCLHDLLWQPLFALFCIVIWAAWIERKINWRIAFPFIGTVGITMYSLSLVKEHYLRLLAGAADTVMMLLQQNISFHNRLWLITRVSDSFVSTSGAEVLYQFAGVSVSYWQDMLAIAVFWGFMAVSIANSPGHGAKGRKQTVRSLLLGTFVLLVLHLIEMTLVGLLLQRGIGQDSIADVLWALRGFCLVTPVLLWLFMDGRALSKISGGFSPSRAPEPLLSQDEELSGSVII